MAADSRSRSSRRTVSSDSSRATKSPISSVLRRDTVADSHARAVQAHEVVAERLNVAGRVLKLVPTSLVARSELPNASGPRAVRRDESQVLFEASRRRNALVS